MKINHMEMDEYLKMQLIPKLEEAASGKKKGAYVVAIDGRAAAGKSTLADRLAELIGGSVIHMDDFFLPSELRTEERLREAGGNVHYERFQSDVIPYLEKEEAFSYTRFDCGKMAYGEQREVSASKWRIIEGSYSCHPVLGDYMDIRLFLTVSAGTQMERLKARNGEAKASLFRTQWIPMEEKYFETYGIAEKADIQMESDV